MFCTADTFKAEKVHPLSLHTSMLELSLQLRCHCFNVGYEKKTLSHLSVINEPFTASQGDSTTLQLHFHRASGFHLRFSSLMGYSVEKMCYNGLVSMQIGVCCCSVWTGSEVTILWLRDIGFCHFWKPFLSFSLWIFTVVTCSTVSYVLHSRREKGSSVECC